MQNITSKSSLNFAYFYRKKYNLKRNQPYNKFSER